VTTDGTATKQDTSEVTQDTSGAKQETSDAQPTTYTKEQVEELTKKAASDALAAAGRDAKSISELRAQIDKQQEQLANDRAAWVKQQRDAELASAEPDEAERIRAKHKWEDERDEMLAKQQATEAEIARLKDIEAKFNTTQVLGSYMIIGAKYDIDAAELQEASEKLGLTDEEKIDELAQRLKKRREPIKADSNLTSGSSKPVSEMSPDEKIEAGLRKLKSK
jgi:hypothetical protein